jgi:Do/DeqQ family serine protease
MKTNIAPEPCRDYPSDGCGALHMFCHSSTLACCRLPLFPAGGHTQHAHKPALSFGGSPHCVPADNCDLTAVSHTDSVFFERASGLAMRLYAPLSAALLAVVLAACDRPNQVAPSPGRAPTIVVERSEPVRSVGGTTSYAPILERAAPSVVSVYSSKSSRGQLNPLLDAPMLRRFFGPDERGPRGRPESMGSGVIVSSDGYILTNNHVVDGADEVRVALANGQEYTARLIGVDPGTDIAVLKIQGTDVPSAVLADSTKIRVGDLAFAIGNPFGVGQTVTMGIVSGTERTGFGITEYEDFIQTDAAVNPGNSGGPLIDAEGRVIGINTAILSRSGGNQGIGFAVPINLARFTMEQLIKNGRVIRGYLGVYIRPSSADPGLRPKPAPQPGALIGSVAPGSPAAGAGIKPGDLVIAVNGKKIEGAPELRLAIAQIEPGSMAKLQVVRSGKEVEIPVKVGQMPPRDAAREG